MLRTKLIAVLTAGLMALGASSAHADSPDSSVVKVQTGTGTNNTWTCPTPVSVVVIPIKNVSAAPVTVAVADGNGSSLSGASRSYSRTSVALAAGATDTISVTVTADDGARPTGKLTVNFSVAGLRANTGDDWHIHMKCPEPDGGTGTADVTAPTLTWTFDGVEGSAGWYVTGGSLIVTCNDGGADYAGTGGGELLADGTYEMVLTCTDDAGNTATENVTIEVDSIVPTVTWTGSNRTYDVDETVLVSCTAADSGSGIATHDCGVEAAGVAYTLGLGSHDLSASATDVAGNHTQSSTTYSVVPTAEGTCRLIPQLVTNQGVANSLCVKIRNSQAAATRGQAKTELNVLDAFDQEVRAQTNKKIVPGGDAVLLAISSWLRTH